MASVSKRQFLRTIGGAGAAAILTLATWQRLFAETAAIAPADLAKDDGFWESIRKRFVVTPDFVQLENGYYSLTAEPVLDSYINHVRRINAVRVDEMPFKRPLEALGEEIHFDSGDYHALLDITLKHVDWAKLNEELAARRKQGEMVGVGLAMNIM